MSKALTLGGLEQLVLLAILRLQDQAYGVSIRTEIAERTGRRISPGALYTTLDRLEDKGALRSRVGDPSPERGGRAKRYYSVTASGGRAVVFAQRAFHNLLEGLDLTGLSYA
ncbi:MAG: PadR family transcriptional regulator [Acidobacteria bacterium]|nr:PadR family transcriptional regulator [Acidobacteriota bacterium]